jgi:hypothetical protein
MYEAEYDWPTNDADGTYSPYNGNLLHSDDSGDYIIPYSSERLLTESDLWGLSARELQLARNEIYARNGRKFQTAELQDYFNSQSWYYGMYEPAEFDANVNTFMSDIEIKNVTTIKKYEDSH